MCVRKTFATVYYRPNQSYPPLNKDKLPSIMTVEVLQSPTMQTLLNAYFLDKTMEIYLLTYIPFIGNKNLKWDSEPTFKDGYKKHTDTHCSTSSY